jgi:hypothetical protein
MGLTLWVWLRNELSGCGMVRVGMTKGGMGDGCGYEILKMTGSRVRWSSGLYSELLTMHRDHLHLVLSQEWLPYISTSIKRPSLYKRPCTFLHGLDVVAECSWVSPLSHTPAWRTGFTACLQLVSSPLQLGKEGTALKPQFTLIHYSTPSKCLNNSSSIN